MSKGKFDDFLKRQQDEATTESNTAFDPKEQLEQWLKLLGALYDQIEDFLREYVDRGAAKILRRDIPLNEDFVGSYLASELLLTIGRSTVTFTPIGTMLIGTKGRVDVKGPRGTARLALVNKKITNARQLIQITVATDTSRPAPPTPSQAVKQIEWTWKISTPPPEMQFIDLGQDSFFDMLLGLVDG